MFRGALRPPYQSKTISCRQCGNTWPSYEEKGTDVNIAVSIVADAAAAASDLALIISADSDLCPAIRTARSLNSLLPDVVGDPAAGRVHRRPGK